MRDFWKIVINNHIYLKVQNYEILGSHDVYVAGYGRKSDYGYQLTALNTFISVYCFPIIDLRYLN